MALPEWLNLLGASLGGGFTVKILDILYQELKQRKDRSRSAKRFVDEHLTPLLKAADELMGKLRSLAESDFRELHDEPADSAVLTSPDFSGTLYLLARFWAHIEIVRQQGLSVAMSQDERGQKLQNFLDCLESRRVRIVDRITQRAIGEVMLERPNGALDTQTFVKFVETFESKTDARRWMQELVRMLSRVKHTHERQKLLQYGVVVHALIDTLDPKHFVTRERPAYSNKLTKRSWRDLKYRVFGKYLTFVRNSEKYLGPPKKKHIPRKG